MQHGPPPPSHSPACLPLLTVVLALLPSALAQANPVGRDSYRPIAKHTPVADATEPSLEYIIDKMPDASYNWIQVSVGGRHTCGIKLGSGYSDGKDYTGRLFCFGRNTEKQCDVPNDVKDSVWLEVSAGWKTTCGVTQAQPWRVRCFGDDTGGIVAAVPTLPAHWQVVWISVGDQHACLIARDTLVKTAGAIVTAGNNTRSSAVGGNVTCWGNDKFGRVTGTYPDGAEFVAGVFPTSLQGRFVQVCAATSHSCALDTSGAIWCWGSNTIDRAKVPPSMKDVIWQSITCNGAHTCAIDINNWPACWGYGVHGQLELYQAQYDNAGKRLESDPMQFRTISAGRTHTCGIVLLPPNKLKCSETGTANTVSINGMCFGDVTYGQVVLQKANPYGVPMKPPFTRDRITERCYVHQWKQLSAGGYHTCGITVKDGNGRNQMVCWGLADDGQTAPYYPGSAASSMRVFAWTAVVLLLACTSHL